jgi:hypothetical protein
VFSEIYDQAAVGYYIYNEPDYNHSNINKWFLLLNNQEPFYINIHKKIAPAKLESVICASLNDLYHNEVTPKNLKFFKI